MSNTTDPSYSRGDIGWFLLGWSGALVVIYSCLGPVWMSWSTSVIGPYGGVDAVLQAGLLEWSARHWQNIPIWLNLPIFHPLSGGIGLMDTLLGQSWLVMPTRFLPGTNAITQYNLAFLGTLLLAAVAMGTLWRAAHGRARTAGVAGLFLVGAPFTMSQLGHLNQLPPPFVIFAFTALVFMLHRFKAGVSSRLPIFLLSSSIVLQATWGWYGLAYAAVGVPVFSFYWLICDIRQKRTENNLSWRNALAAKIPRLLRIILVPLIIVCILVFQFARPQRDLGRRHPDFTRTQHEVLRGSADFKHFFNEGAFRLGFSDLQGDITRGEARTAGRDRHVLSPGWLCLALAILGFWKRRSLPLLQRRTGFALLAAGLAGLILAFGDSVGLPFTDKRLIMPMEVLRAVAPPFRAFRAVWRFSWLMTIAVAWWATVGVEVLLVWSNGKRFRRILPVLAILSVTLVSLPVGLPMIDIPLDGTRRIALFPQPGPVLTLPAPEVEFAEDRIEAMWLLRTLQTGQAVTGGASGWVPREVRELRHLLKSCETGKTDPHPVFDKMRESGIVSAELALRPGDSKRIDFWRQALLTYGARRSEPWPVTGYEMYRLAPNSLQRTPRSSKNPE